MSAIVARTLSEICRALALGAAKIGTATAGLLSRSERSAYSEAPSSRRATSRSRVTAPPASVFTMMSPNSSSVASRPWAFTESCSWTSGNPGEAPTTPAAAWRFCSRMARTTSPAERPRSATRLGSSHTRMA
jgi:hypothetical protein